MKILKEGDSFICIKDYKYISYSTINSSRYKILIFRKNLKYIVHYSTKHMLYFYCSNIINGSESEYFGVNSGELSTYFMELKRYRRLKLVKIGST